MGIITNRRAFLGGALALVAAPAIIRVENLMPVKLMLPEPETVFYVSINQRASYRWVAMTTPEGKFYSLINGQRQELDAS